MSINEKFPYPSESAGYPQLGTNQHEMIPQSVTPQFGFQQTITQPIPTHQSPFNQFKQNIPQMNDPNEPPPPYVPQILSPLTHPTPVAIQIPITQQIPNPNIVINNENDNIAGRGGLNAQNPEQIAALINMKIVKCPFCGMGTLKQSIKYRQMIIFCLITVFFFPFGLLIWCCLCCNNVHKRTCTNCNVEA